MAPYYVLRWPTINTFFFIPPFAKDAGKKAKLEWKSS